MVQNSGANLEEKKRSLEPNGHRRNEALPECRAENAKVCTSNTERKTNTLLSEQPNIVATHLGTLTCENLRLCVAGKPSLLFRPACLGGLAGAGFTLLRSQFLSAGLAADSGELRES